MLSGSCTTTTFQGPAEVPVTRIILENSEGVVRASGVELWMENGKNKHIVNTTREVICCAGS
jgi:hypothetical protein